MAVAKKKSDEKEQTTSTMKVVKDEPAGEKISIFGAAKVKTPSASPKTDKVTVTVTGMEDKLLEMQSLKAQIADLEAQLAGVTDEVKNKAKEQFIELYKKNKTNPNTFQLQDGSGCIVVIPTDKYISIKDEERANMLKAEYGDDVVTTSERYYFNTEVLERNQSAIEKIIMDATTISDSDKENLLTKEVKYSITKGMIDRLASFGDRMENVIDDIQPIIALKNCGGKMDEGGAVVLEDYTEFIITDMPVFRGFSDCCYAPVYGEADVCSRCGEHCSVLTEEDASKELELETSAAWKDREIDEDDFIEEEVEFAKGGGVLTKERLRSLWKKYEKNEDDNDHTENVVLLAKHFGTAEDLKAAKDIEERHNKSIGGISNADYQEREKISMRLYPLFITQLKEHGVLSGGGSVGGDSLIDLLLP